MNPSSLGVVIEPLLLSEALWLSYFLKWSWGQGTGNVELGPLITPVMSCISHASVPATLAFRNSLGTDVVGASQTENLNPSESTGERKSWEYGTTCLRNQMNEHKIVKTLPGPQKGLWQAGGQSLGFRGFLLDLSPDSGCSLSTRANRALGASLWAGRWLVALPFLRPQVHHRMFAQPWALSCRHLHSVWKEWVGVSCRQSLTAWGWAFQEQVHLRDPCCFPGTAVGPRAAN